MSKEIAEAGQVLPVGWLETRRAELINQQAAATNAVLAAEAAVLVAKSNLWMVVGAIKMVDQMLNEFGVKPDDDEDKEQTDG